MKNPWRPGSHPRWPAETRKERVIDMAEVIRSIPALQEWSMNAKKQGRKVGLVPTMGFLHAGHLSLIDTARKNGADVIAVSIFVNPTQFGPNEDFDRYPRDFEHDRALCESKGVDVIFAPGVNDMYAGDLTCWVQEEKISKGLCGITRPIHFRGVATVVAKLFNAALPDIAVFGQKDAQQAAVIKRMVRDLNFPVRVVVSPIVREDSGLAMSSRNKYLSEDEKKRALSISQSLFAAKAALESGASADVKAVRDEIAAKIAAAGGRVDYVEVLDAETMLPRESEDVRRITIAVAAYFGTTRLIDNIRIDLK